MNKNSKLQVIVIAIVALLLVLLLVAAMLLMPTGSTGGTPSSDPASSDPSSSDVSSDDTSSDDTTDVVVKKYDFVARVYDKDGKPLANTKLGISYGPTTFKTDANGYFRLNNLPTGEYKLYVEKNGKPEGSTTILLSGDGCFSLGYKYFEKGKTVVMKYDGEKFVAYEVPAAPSTPSTPSTPEEPVEPEEPEDTTFTDLSWMKDIPGEFGAYGLNATFGVDYFNDIVTNPDYAYVNTFLIGDSGEEADIWQAKLLAENGKKLWLNVKGLLVLGNYDLRGDWREQLNARAARIYEVAGDALQGFYFDEPDLYLNKQDFARVTQYMREHFGLRTFAVHRRNPFTDLNGVPIANYKGSKFIINAENHKFVTDVGYWWYGGYDFYGYNAESLNAKWDAALALINPNVRSWIVPPISPFDFRHNEEDMLEVAYAMYREASKSPNFGGLMFYTMGHGTLWGGYSKITEENAKLTDDDFLKDEKGNFVLDAEGKKIVWVKENNSWPGVQGYKDYTSGGYGYHFVLEKLEDGSYRWQRGHDYFEIIGKGITSGKDRDDILADLAAVFKPDYDKFKK